MASGALRLSTIILLQLQSFRRPGTYKLNGNFYKNQRPVGLGKRHFNIKILDIKPSNRITSSMLI